MAKATLTTVAELYKDMYPAPGERLKQWVVDTRREDDREAETCPKVGIGEHDDNTGTTCRNEGSVRWTWLNHDCCYVCGDLHEQTRETEAVQAWLAEKAKGPPIESDHAKLSDEVQEDYGERSHPFMKGPR